MINDQKMIDKIVKWLSGYIKRNKEFDNFCDDINSLGGSFDIEKDDNSMTRGYLECNKKSIIIKDNNFEEIFKISTKEIWENAHKNTLF